MTRKQLKDLERIIARLEAWQGAARLTQGDQDEAEAAKQKLMNLWNKYDNALTNRD